MLNRDGLYVDLNQDLRRIMSNHGMEASSQITGQIIDDIIDNGTSRKAPNNYNFDGGRSYINLIPSSKEGMCSPELIVLCYDKDNFTERLREMIYHAGIYCKDINTRVMLLTTKWPIEHYKIHEKAINVLRNNGLNIFFVFIGPKGVSELPN